MMLAAVKRWQLETEDRLKYSSMVRNVVCRLRRWSAPAVNGDQQVLARSIQKLCAAARLADSDATVQTIQKQIHERLAVLRPSQVDWTEFVEHIKAPQMPRTVLLKPALGPREKGVLFVSFEKEWFKLLQQCDLKQFSDRYLLVLAPSSSPHNLLNYVFAAAYPDTLFTLISNASDKLVLPRVSSHFAVLPLYASQWVKPELFQPRPWAERDFDLIMVANFAKVKRHYALFAALRRMSPTLRVLLVGQDQDGRTVESIHREAMHFGVADRLTIQRNAKYPEVSAALCRSRASVILSRREGSCVVVAESLFADTPVGLLQDAEIGSRAFIHPQTGLFLDERRLAEQLSELIEKAPDFAPRQWAEANVSCHHSSRRLNENLKTHALATGQEWTQDIATLCWRPDPRLAHAADAERLQDERLRVHATFGLEVGPRPGD